MKFYTVANWEKYFETAETGKLKHLKWVPIPNKHDGLGYKRLAQQKNSCELFAAWNLILQVASKGAKDTERGKLIRDGIPLTPDDLALMTCFPSKIFVSAFEFFSSAQMRWLIVEGEGVATISGESPAIPADHPAIPASSPAEGKEGKEGMEGEGKGFSFSDLVFPQHLRTERFTKVFNQWSTFRLTLKKPKGDWLGYIQSQVDWLGEFPEETAAQMVARSYRERWQGIFELTKNSQPNKQPSSKYAIPNI